MPMMTPQLMMMGQPMMVSTYGTTSHTKYYTAQKITQPKKINIKGENNNQVEGNNNQVEGNNNEAEGNNAEAEENNEEGKEKTLQKQQMNAVDFQEIQKESWMKWKKNNKNSVFWSRKNVRKYRKWRHLFCSKTKHLLQLDIWKTLVPHH